MTEPSPITENPFLDPYSPVPGGSASVVGEPLNRLSLPSIKTLVHKTGETVGSLSMVNVDRTLSQAGILPKEPSLITSEDVGISLNISLLGAGPKAPVQLTPTGKGVAQIVGRTIPTNMREAHKMMKWISPARTGSSNTVFGIVELKQIARNLNLPTSGGKSFLAERILNAIREHFNIPPGEE